MTIFLSQMVFLITALAFVYGLKLMAFPKTARLGNFIGAFAMGLAVFFTLLIEKPTNLWPIMATMAFGSIAGVLGAQKVKMTSMPQFVALLNGFGGIASVFVSFAEIQKFSYLSIIGPVFFIVSSWFSIVVGAITFSGSLIAYLKLEELIETKPLFINGQRVLSFFILLISLFSVIYLINNPDDFTGFLITALIAVILGVLLVLPIGGADMPVVISLLNSYSGIAAMAAGFVVKSNLLIIAGSLVGASGIILTKLMCQAMNRSLMNVVFGAFGKSKSFQGLMEEKPMREFLPIDVALLLANAQRVIIVPGYGLAVSQAQRNLRDLGDELKKKNIKVSYAIHPVAGRMPGHMNVLLAEADISYDELFDLDLINNEFENADVAIVVGANDVVNPESRTNKNSPLYGMPILNADKAKTVVVLKRGKGKGFSQVENPLFTLENTGVVFGDAKSSLGKIVQELKAI